MRMAHPKSSNKDRRIEGVLNFINNNIGNKISIDYLADMACVSKDYLIRLFKKEMHMTPLCYINKRKIEKAQIRLVTEATSIKEIAYQLGFEEQAYFNRVFKSFTGLSPMVYRKNN